MTSSALLAVAPETQKGSHVCPLARQRQANQAPQERTHEHKATHEPRPSRLNLLNQGEIDLDPRSLYWLMGSVQQRYNRMHQQV